MESIEIKVDIVIAKEWQNLTPKLRAHLEKSFQQ